MIPVSTEIEGLIHPLALRTDEYLNEDNLICCSKCHTPRQKRINAMGKTMEPRCMCVCQTADHEKREQERKHQEFLDMVERNRSVGLPDPELRKYTFENDLGYNPKQIAMAKQYVQHWEEFLNTSTGLLLWGNVGTGKSFIAGCIADALLDKGVPVIMTNFARLLNKLTDMYSGDRNAYIDSFRKFPLMIITTNLSLEELKDTTDLSKARIYGRVLERCLPIRVNEQNIRELNQAAVLARAKQLLNGT